ncbi:MAG: hypothetical protein EPN55_05795 [Gammaproteobacteria bacterium]|nr:MAG: hypothetical protein EPN55_05795 [Gammaproteobacteria bacterium]
MKATRTAHVSEGNHRRFSLDPQTEARLKYLVAFYREVVGVKVSSSGVIRRAVADLAALADDLTRLVRVLPRSHELIAERVQMGQAMQGDKAPWTGNAPELAGVRPFPTFGELREQREDRRTVLDRLRGKKGGKQDAAENTEQVRDSESSPLTPVRPPCPGPAA